jgi:TolB-like protein
MAAEAMCKHFIVQESLIPDANDLAGKNLSGLITLAKKSSRLPNSVEAKLLTLQGHGNQGSHDQWPEPPASLEDIQLGMAALEGLATWYSETSGEEGFASPNNSSGQESASGLSWNQSKAWILGGLAGLLACGMGAAWMLQRNPQARIAEPLASPVRTASTGPSPTPTPKDANARRIAVLYFDDHSRNQALAPLRTGLTDMLISDLDGARAVRVIERERLNAVLDELHLQASTTVDPATSQRIGRVLGVEFLLLGSYFELMGQLRVDARLVRVETGEIVRSEGVTGASQDLFALERQLALKILQGLGAHLDEGERDRLKQGGSADLPHLLAYARALDLYDRGDRRAAVSALEEVVRLAPAFPQAERSLSRMRNRL